MHKTCMKFLLAAFVLSIAHGGIAYSAQTINGKALGSVDDVVKEVNKGDLSLPKKGLITLRGGDKIGDVDIFATTFGTDASSSTRRLWHNSNATQQFYWSANSPYYLRPAVSRKLYNGKRALMTHDLAPNGQLKYYFKTLSNTRSENSTATTPQALVNSVQISDFGEYTTATFSNVENYHVMEVYGTGVMSVKGYDREIFVGASGAARSLTTHQNGGYQRVYRNDNEVRLEFFALNADSEGNMSQTPLTELTHETPYRGDPSLAIISLAVGDIDGDKYDNEVVLMITTLNEIRFFVYRLTFSDGKLTLRSLNEASGQLVHSTDQWGDDLESQSATDMAVGDFDGDGRDEIAVIFKFSERATALANDKGWKRGPMTGSVHCRVFQWNTTKQAFDIAGTIQNYNKEELVDSATNIMPSAKVAGVVGLRATAADLDGDGKDEIVTLLLGYYHSKSWDSKMNPICVRIDDFYVFPHLAVWTFNRGSIKPVHDDAHIMGGGKVMSANGKTNLYDFSWLYQHSSNKNGLLLSDTEPFLQYGRSWQRIIFPFPMDPTESVTGTNPDSITHMYALVEFSIAAGPFTGTLGQLKTVDDIAVAWKRNGQDRVTVFKTKLNSAKQFDGFEDGKLALQETKTGGTWRGLVAVDIASEGVELDRPVHLRKTSNRSYIAALSAVPYHVDNVKADGSALQEQPHNFTYSDALNGGNMTVTYGKSTTDSTTNSVTMDLSQTVETMFIADPTGTDTNVQGIFGAVKGITAFASAIGEIVHGAQVGAMSTEEKRNAVWKPDSPTEGLTDIMEFLTDKVDSIDQRTNSETTTTTIDKEITATTHDAILYTDTARHIWRYPVMTRPLPMWLAWGPRVDSTPVNADGQRGNKELYLTFTMSENSALRTLDSITDSLYQPLHEEGNFFSYPSQIGDVEGYNDAGLLADEATWGFSNTLDNTGITFTKATSNMQHTEKKVTPSGFTSTISFFDRLINGQNAKGMNMPDSDNPKTFSKSYSKTERISYSLQGSSLLTAERAADYTVKMQPFVAKEGAMTLGTAVELSSTNYASLWEASSIYQRKPDPALLLPQKFKKKGADFIANTHDQSATKLRGMKFYVPSFAFYSDNRLLNGLNYEIRVPLYNASFKDTGNFNVRLSWTESNTPTATKTTIATVQMSLGGWRNDKNNNKGTATFNWTPNLTPGKKYFFCVEIDPDNALDEVHEGRYEANSATVRDYGGNNMGFYPFTAYNTDDITMSSSGFITANNAMNFSASDAVQLSPLSFTDEDGNTINDMQTFINTHSNDSFIPITANFTNSGPEVSYAFLVGYVLTPSGKQKLPNASINTIVNLNELEASDVEDVFMLEDIALLNGRNQVTFNVSPSELRASANEIAALANSATFGILTLTQEELQAVEEFFAGVDPSFDLPAIPLNIVASSTTETYTLSSDVDVFWKIASVDLGRTVSTSDVASDDRDYLDITLETVSMDTASVDTAAPSDYGKIAIITVSSIAGYTPKGEYAMTVQKSTDGDEWTNAGVLKFTADDDRSISSSSSGCDSGISALGLGILFVVLMIKRKAR